MSRIAKDDVHSALDIAGKNIIAAQGQDGVTSKKDLKAAVAKLGPSEKALTEQLFRFIDKRDANQFLF